MLKNGPPGHGTVEFFGGHARASHWCVRRHLASGGNWDLVRSCNLDDPAVQRAAMHYLDTTGSYVAVMAPTCTPYGPLSNFNYAMHYDSSLASYRQASPHGKFCGIVAIKQLTLDRYFMNEQPYPSWLYQEEPWGKVMQHPRVDSRVIDQCMTGQRGPQGWPVKKPTGIVASDPRLLKPVERFVCDKWHGGLGQEHEHPTGTGLAT